MIAVQALGEGDRIANTASGNRIFLVGVDCAMEVSAQAVRTYASTSLRTHRTMQARILAIDN